MIKGCNETKKITMNKGDFGVIYPINFSGDVLDTDIIKFTIKLQGTEVISKEFTAQNNTINFVLTKTETDLLDIGEYTYSMKQYREETLVNTIVVDKVFKVIKGA